MDMREQIRTKRNSPSEGERFKIGTGSAIGTNITQWQKPEMQMTTGFENIASQGKKQESGNRMQVERTKGVSVQNQLCRHWETEIGKGSRKGKW